LLAPTSVPGGTGAAGHVPVCAKVSWLTVVSLAASSKVMVPVTGTASPGPATGVESGLTPVGSIHVVDPGAMVMKAFCNR